MILYTIKIKPFATTNNKLLEKYLKLKNMYNFLIIPKNHQSQQELSIIYILKKK